MFGMTASGNTLCTREATKPLFAKNCIQARVMM